MTHETTQGDFTSAVFLVNGYVDFGTWYGITPFIGAGAGVARNMLSGFSETSLTTIAGVTTPSGGWIGDNDKTHFAWALYAGLGYAERQARARLPLPEPRRIARRSRRRSSSGCRW